MTTDIFGRVKFADGEGIELDDLDGLGARALAILWDQLIGSCLPREGFVSTIHSTFDPTVSPYAYALSVPGAMPYQGSANNKLKIAAGTLMQAVAAADGTEPKLLAFTFGGTDEVTIANGDPANPRVDIVQMKLEYLEDTATARDFQDAATRALSSITPNIRRRVKCTLSVKQGTPAASPTYPTPDAGNVVIAGIVVGTNYVAAAGFAFDDTAGAVAVLHDQRLPLRVRPHTTMPWEYNFIPAASYDVGANFSIINRFYIAKTSGGVETLGIVHRSEGQVGRLVSVAIPFTDPATENSKLSKLTWFDGGGFLASNHQVLNGANVNGSGSGLFSRRASGNFLFQSLHAPAAGPTIQNAANGMGAPVWTNGRRCPVDPVGTFPIAIDQLELQFVNPANNSQFGPCTFFVAEGLT